MEKSCRTCLRTSDNLFPLYNNSELIHKIEVISSEKLLEYENYPSRICEECISNINKFYNFRKVIINTNKEIKEQSEVLQQTNHNNGLQIEEHQHLIKEIKLAELTNSAQQAISNISQAKIYNCCDCGEGFASKYKFLRHKRTGHPRRAICTICGITIRCDNLSKHVKLHSAEPVSCEHCGKVFKNMESLRGHSLIHQGNLFVCDVCGMTFKVKTEYKRHLRGHEDPDVLKSTCKVCGGKFSHLKRHMLRHTGERPYLCDFCNKGFASPYSLKVHKRQHTNEKPYKCELCPLAFPQKVSLVSHLQSKHNVV